MKKAFVSGYGLISPAGIGFGPLEKHLHSGVSFVQEGLAKIPHHLLPMYVKTNGSFHADNLNPFLDKAVILALASITNLFEQRPDLTVNSFDTILLATTSSQITIWENSLPNDLNEELLEKNFHERFQRESFSSLLNSICDHLSFSGKRYLITTACTASTQALITAKNLIENSHSKRILVCSLELLSKLTIEGFANFKLLSKKHASPFSKGRDGINLSEASVAFIVEEQSFLDEKMKLAHLKGGAYSCDAYHMTAPHPEGLGASHAIEAAIKNSFLDKNEIDWIHAHGTGSIQNDISESLAIQRIFTNNIPDVSSTKHIHGHALGTSGSIEIAICLYCLQHNLILPNYGYTEVDSNIGISSSLVNSFKEKKIKNILKLSLGFGGANSALILGAKG